MHPGNQPASFNMPEIRMPDGHRGFLIYSVQHPTDPDMQNACVLVPGRHMKPIEAALPMHRRDVQRAQQQARCFSEVGPARANGFGLGLVRPDGTPLA